MSEQILSSPKRGLKIPKMKKGNFRLILSKLSGAFMLPISLLAFAGIFLGVGAAINSHTDAKTFGNFIQQIGNGTFAILPLLFCVSIAIAYTDSAAVAGFSAVVGWMTFNGLTSSLIFANGAGADPTSYSILGFGGSIYGEASVQLMTSNQGFTSFNTSVFGAISAGCIVAWVYNHFSETELPMVISFFSGKRLAPIMTVVFMIPLTFIFLFIWPLVGKALFEIGKGLGKAPGSLNALAFGFLERSLVPFGLHHVFYAPLWWTSAGGYVDQNSFANALSGGAGVTFADFSSWLSTQVSQGHMSQADANILQGEMNGFMGLWDKQGFQRPSGDVYTWFFAQGLPSDTSYWTGSGLKTKATFDFFSSNLGVDIGQYMQGKYPFMIFGLPAAAAAITMAAPKENRKMAASVAISAVASSFISGITEPIEFTFLFLAPWLFWGVHAVFAAISFWLMALFGAHIGMTFSGGMIDYIVYGLIPWSHGTNAWLVLVLGPVYAVVYFFTFYFCITKFNIETPGRGNNTKFFTKKDYLAKKDGANVRVNADGTLSMENQFIVAGLGGWDNIESYNNCATRLRYGLKDTTKIDEDLLKQGKAHGIMKMGGSSVQVIIGPRADVVNGEISRNKGTPITVGKGAVRPSTGKTQEIQRSKIEKLAKKVEVQSVAVGKLKSLQKVNDPVFANKTLGEGIAVVPTKGEIYAPISGTLVTVFPTSHAFGIETPDGVQILVHAGVDTVKLDGKGFDAVVKQGDTVKAGQLLAKMDLKFIEEQGYPTDIIVILLNESKGKIKLGNVTGDVTKTSTIFEVI